MNRVLFLLLFSVASLLAEAPWPGVPYQEVRAFAWADLRPHVSTENGLIRDDMSFVDGVINKEGAVLNADQVTRLLKAQSRRRQQQHTAGCYNPHNAFVFFDADHRPVAYLEVCFDCLGSRTTPNDDHCDPDFSALAGICSELQLPFGEYKTVKEFKQHTDWILNPPEPGSPIPKGVRWVPAGIPGVETLAKTTEEQLPTRRDLAIKECGGAVVAKLESIGDPEVAGAAASYYKSRWTILKTLRGEYPPKARFEFHHRETPEARRERLPTVGETYILVMFPGHKTRVASMFEATEEKVQEIQRLLRAKSK